VGAPDQQGMGKNRFELIKGGTLNVHKFINTQLLCHIPRIHHSICFYNLFQIVIHSSKYFGKIQLIQKFELDQCTFKSRLMKFLEMWQQCRKKRPKKYRMKPGAAVHFTEP
jgi:hypothetical protein